MITAKKIDHTFSVLTPVKLDGTKHIKRTNPLLRESQEIFELMGWSSLPDEVKLVIAIDLIGFRDELKGLYSTNSPYVIARRKSIYYWINMLMNGSCSEQTAIQALKIGNESLMRLKAI
jgi:hypothetical protein